MVKELPRSVLHVNTNTLSRRVRMLKSVKEIAELPEDCNEIFKSGILEYCMMRSKQINVKNMCLLCLHLIILSQRILKITISQIALIVIQE